MRLTKMELKRIYRATGYALAFACMAVTLGGCGTVAEDGLNAIESAKATDDAEGDANAASDAKDDTASETGSNYSGDNYYVDGSAITYKELSEGEGAPNFEAELKGGEKFVLSDQAGKVVLINIWATWCGPCVGEMPAFERLKNEYGDKLQIVCVNCMEPKSDVDAFIDDNGYTFPVAYDESGEIMNRYPTEGIPYTLVIGKNGQIKNTYIGSEGEEEQYQKYKAAIDAALAE